MTTHLCLLLLFACVFTGSSNPSSCRGRCGEGYYRGSLCQCDHECLGLNECCTDFLDLCTTKDSCKGRCGEPFNRGNPCHCDIDCVSYNQCCPDYENMCLIEDTALKPRYPGTAAQRIANLCLNIKNKKPTETSNEEMTNEEGTGDELMIPNEESVSITSEGLEISLEGTHTASDTEDKLRENSTALSENQTSSLLPSTPSPTLIPVDENWMESVTQQPTPSTSQLQEKTSTAPTEGPTSVSQSDGLTSTSPTEGPTSVSESDGLTSTSPTEGPTSVSQSDGLTSTSPTEGPTSVSQSEVPTTASASDGSTISSQTEGPINAASTRVSTSTAPSEGSTSAEPPEYLTPSEGPTSTTLTEVPGRDAEADGSSTTPTIGPILEPVTESYLPDPVITSVPKKTPPIPSPVKPTKKPTQPSTDKNGKSEPKDTTSIATNKPGEKPLPLKPSIEINGKTESIKDYQADDYDTNICSGRPVSGLTTLRNGTIVVFRGHYFWTLDKHRNPDPPQLITRVWGIPSPIDTVYTRCNCEGKTYFFKGKNYWRFDNGLMDPGFPKTISQGFGQIGHITAALSIPEYRSRKESVIFFRRGGMAQKYTYQVTPNCGKQLTNSMVTVRIRKTRQAAAALGQVINISKTWRGFPTMVTSAVSVPSRVREGYKYYVFSPKNYYSMKMERDKPVVLQTATGQKENPATSFFKCLN